jgi:hypothetical protein
MSLTHAYTYIKNKKSILDSCLRLQLVARKAFTHSQTLTVSDYYKANE